jgi:hypothetical protein
MNFSRYLAGIVLVGALVGCTPLRTQRLTLPEHFTLVRQQLVIHCDFVVAARHRLVDQLTDLRGQIVRQLGLPRSDEPIHVYLFESAERFDQFMALHYPGLPSRRAFFLETDTRLMVFAHWNDRVAEDLRHEVTHGYVHAVLPDLPLWLDEGLAEYFEVPPSARGVNRAHRRRLQVQLEQGSWRPKLVRLEQIAPTGDLSQDDYAESWAWVHFLLNSGPENRELLRRYLADLRQDPATEPLSSRLTAALGDPQGALLAHVRPVVAAGDPRQTAASKAGVTVR